MIEYLSNIVLRLLARCAESSSGQMTRKRMNKFSKYNTQIESCGDDLAKLDRFVDAQRVAFFKLLKKYTVWIIIYDTNDTKIYSDVIRNGPDLERSGNDLQQRYWEIQKVSQDKISVHYILNTTISSHSSELLHQ